MPNSKCSLLPLAAASLALFLSCNLKVPVIESIDPKIGRMGDVITLKGVNFGEEQEESFVTIAGITPTNSSYFAWHDDLIMFRGPDYGESGLVYVYVKGKKSNGVLFSNSAVMPRPIEGEELGIEPKIASVYPLAGTPGTTIIVTGNNFGGSREKGGVFFSWDYEASSPFIIKESEFIEVSETELGYESWNAREIQFRVPDGAVSGIFEIRTPRGKSRPFPFDVSGGPGTKVFRDKRSYTVSYSVDVRVLETTRPNTLYLWIPRPVNSPYQRNVNLLSRSTEPYVEHYRGVDLFKLENLPSSLNTSVDVSYSVDVYAQETGIRPASIENRGSLAVYTQSSNLIPSDNSNIITQANTIIGRERNPYQRARLLYDWIIGEGIQSFSSSASAVNIVTAMEQKQLDSLSAALLYTAMARATGIPCIPVAGVLIDRNAQTLRHYWAEFWIDNFGWIPVDPAMGAGAVPDDFIIKQDTANYYFGNIDSRRIAFSRGELILSQMESRGRLVSNLQLYSLQNIWEEAVGGLESYSSLWGDIIITGIYVQ